MQQASQKLRLITDGKPLTVDRHIDILLACEEIHQDLSSSLLYSEVDLGVLLDICERMSLELESLIGAIRADDLLDSIFGNFCIGK